MEILKGFFLFFLEGDVCVLEVYFKVLKKVFVICFICNLIIVFFWFLGMLYYSLIVFIYEKILVDMDGVVGDWEWWCNGKNVLVWGCWVIF